MNIMFLLVGRKNIIHPESRCGINKITIGKDNADLFPVVKYFDNGVCISRSNITGNFILSGKAIFTSEEKMMNNWTMVTEPDKMFNELTTESINVAPVLVYLIFHGIRVSLTFKYFY